MIALDQLRELGLLIARGGAWVPGYSFGVYDADGRACRPRADDAARFGLLGGLTHIGGNVDERLRAVDLIRAAVGAKHLYAWEQEPGRTEAEVRDAVERAIALEHEGGRP